ncbi:MAG: energy-coupling factor transporter transmembrane protein EcfT [Deltaproteobacteria bacterium]|jgi:energy-coupling factor transport system permease protein|nr:energy-coupling factor transporter transmembrane protein EcfT [Deltaproteobacteria bacterium]
MLKDAGFFALGAPLNELSQEEGFSGAPIKLIFALCAYILALVLNKWEPLVFLAASSMFWALGKIRLGLLIKAYLILAIFLALCLAGAIYLPALIWSRPASTAGSGLTYAILPALRMLIGVNMALVLVITVPAGAISRLISALRLPDFLFVPLIIVFRFIGTFVQEFFLVSEATRAKTGRSLIFLALVKPWKLWRGFFVPMVFRALCGADELALALEMKGLTRKSLFWERPKLLNSQDYYLLFVGSIVLLGSIYLQLQGAIFGVDAAPLANTAMGARVK